MLYIKSSKISREDRRKAGSPGEGGRVLTLEMFTMSILVGLMVGRLAEVFMNGGSYGVTGDIGLGIGGSIVGSWIFQAAGVSPEAGWFVLVVVAFVGAAILIVAQRKVWAHALGT